MNPLLAEATTVSSFVQLSRIGILGTEGARKQNQIREKSKGNRKEQENNFNYTGYTSSK